MSLRSTAVTVPPPHERRFGFGAGRGHAQSGPPIFHVAQNKARIADSLVRGEGQSAGAPAQLHGRAQPKRDAGNEHDHARHEPEEDKQEAGGACDERTTARAASGGWRQAAALKERVEVGISTHESAIQFRRIS